MRLIVAFVLGIVVQVPAEAADPPRVGWLVEVPDADKKIEATAGDVLRFDIGYAVIPEQMVSDLKVEIKGNGLTHIATIHVPNLAPNGQVLIGAMKIAALVRAEKAGEMTVTIVPRLGKKDGEKVVFKVKIGEK